MEGVKNVPSKHDVGGKTELEQYEETLEEGNNTPSESTAPQDVDDEDEEAMLC